MTFYFPLSGFTNVHIYKMERNPVLLFKACTIYILHICTIYNLVGNWFKLLFTKILPKIQKKCKKIEGISITMAQNFENIKYVELKPLNWFQISWINVPIICGNLKISNIQFITWHARLKYFKMSNFSSCFETAPFFPDKLRETCTYHFLCKFLFLFPKWVKEKVLSPLPLFSDKMREKLYVPFLCKFLFCFQNEWRKKYCPPLPYQFHSHTVFYLCWIWKFRFDLWCKLTLISATHYFHEHVGVL